jgi:hypothetical protein
LPLKPDFIAKPDIFRRIIIQAAIMILCILSIVYHIKSFKLLLFVPGYGDDLHKRWLDQRYVLNGQNPYDVYFRYHASEAEKKPVPKRFRNSDADPILGPPPSGGYPQWSFFTGYFLFALPWTLERIYWAIISAAALLFLGYWAYHEVRRRDQPPMLSTLAAASILAISTFGTTIALGQFAVFIVAVLAITLWLDERPLGIFRPSGERIAIACLSGTLLGIAMSKPTITAPFLMVYFFRRRFKTLLATGTYLALASVVISIVTKTDPLEMLHQMMVAGSTYLHDSYGPLTAMNDLGVPLWLAVKIAGIGTVVLAAIPIFFWRDGPPIVLFAIAATCSRLWAYHKLIDNGIIAFLLIALYVQAVTSRSRLLWITFVLAGLTLWPRPKFCDHFWYKLFQCVVWVMATGILLWATPRRVEATAEETALISSDSFAPA